jgi:hypothetical protein
MPGDNQDPNATGGTGGTGGTGNQDPNAGKGGTAVADWKDGLEASIKDHPSLSNFKDMKEVVKSYVNVQHLVGKEKIPVPGEKATKEEWDLIYSRLGRPGNADGYKLPDVKLPDGLPALQEEKLKGFKSKAHELGLLPHQANGLFEWYLGDVSSEFNQIIESRDKSRQESEVNLRKDWGKGFDAKLAMAKGIITQFGGPELAELMNDQSFGNNPAIIKFLANIGSKMSEDGIFIGKGESTMTPDEAKAEIAKIQGDSKHPYFQKLHPEHELSVLRMKDLFQMAYPEKS